MTTMDTFESTDDMVAKVSAAQSGGLGELVLGRPKQMTR